MLTYNGIDGIFKKDLFALHTNLQYKLSRRWTLIKFVGLGQMATGLIIHLWDSLLFYGFFHTLFRTHLKIAMS